MGNTLSSNSDLPQHRVDVVEPGVLARCHWVSCEIGKDLIFDTTGLQTYCFAKWDERVYDVLAVAAAVEFCDRTKARPSTGWSRDFVLRVPVHDPNHWKAISTALCDALSFLTGDRWQIDFIARKAKAPAPWQSNFDMPVNNTHTIIPYSDGLDSYATAGLMLSLIHI